MSKVALCADRASIFDSELIGLGGENLAAQRWLALYSLAEVARASIAVDDELVEVWVAGCDDAATINLAAAIKRDNPRLRVCLADFGGGGSLLSRAHAASIDAVYNESLFVRRYAAVKAAFSGSPARSSGLVEGAAGESDASADERRNCAAGGGIDDRRASHVENRAAPHVLCSGGGGAQLSEARSAGTVFLGRSETTASPRAEGALSSTGRPHVAALKRAFLLPVLSGSGGAGKSTVSAVAALCAQTRGKRTLLLDLDFQFGNVAGFFRGVKPLEVDRLLGDPLLIDELEPAGCLPAIIAPPRNPEETELIVRRTADLLDLVESRFDVVVVNTGALWVEQHALLLERSSKALLLVDQRASSLQACRRALLLCERCGLATGPLLFAVNRCGKGAPLTSIDVSCALKGVEAVELSEGGREVEEFSASGALAELAVASNPLYASVSGLLSAIVPGLAEAQGDVLKPSDSRSRRRGFFRKGEGK